MVLRNWGYAMPVSTHGISTCCSRFPSPRASGPWLVPTRRTKEDGGVSASLDGYNQVSLPHVCSLPWLWLKAKPWTLIRPHGAGCNWGLRVSLGRDWERRACPACIRPCRGWMPISVSLKPQRVLTYLLSQHNLSCILISTKIDWEVGQKD